MEGGRVLREMNRRKVSPVWEVREVRDWTTEREGWRMREERSDSLVTGSNWKNMCRAKT